MCVGALVRPVFVLLVVSLSFVGICVCGFIALCGFAACCFMFVFLFFEFLLSCLCLILVLSGFVVF